MADAPKTGGRGTNVQKSVRVLAAKSNNLMVEEETLMERLLEKMMDKRFDAMLEERLVKMEAGMGVKIKEEITREMESQKRDILDVELQKRIVAKDLNKRREERGGYDSLKGLMSDGSISGKMEM